MPDENAPEGTITKGALIVAELKGKHEAIGRYDAILWRVRSGYAVVLYGSLLLFTGKEGGLATLLEKPALVWTALATAFVLGSILACMDLDLRLRQLGVFAAFNRLSDVVFALAAGREAPDHEVRPLLHVAGESTVSIERLKRVRAVFLIGSLYLGPPSLAFAAYAVMRRAWWA